MVSINWRGVATIENIYLQGPGPITKSDLERRGSYTKMNWRGVPLYKINWRGVAHIFVIYWPHLSNSFWRRAILGALMFYTLSSSNMAEFPLEILQRLLRDLVMFTDGRMISDASLDTCIVLLEFVYCELIALDSEIMTAPQLNLISVIGFLRNALSIARLICESCKLTNSNHHLQLQPPFTIANITGSHWISRQTLHSDFTGTTVISH